jgi:putative transcriptional regulator
MPRHHPGDEILMAHAAGSLAEPFALLVATHMALCPACRAEVCRLEALGGVLLDELPASAVAADGKQRLMARLDEAAPDEPAGTPAAGGDMALPRPLRDLVTGPAGRKLWRFAGGFSYIALPSPKGFRVRLLSIRPGHGVPHHTHEGTEMALVLAGGFKEGDRQFLRGDVAEADATIDHRQIADPGEPCLCLAVTEGRLHLTGPLGRLVDPLLRL